MQKNREFANFSSLVDHVLSVPKTEILRREAEYQKSVDENPNRPGPKRGWKPKNRKKIKSASPGPAAS